MSTPGAIDDTVHCSFNAIRHGSWSIVGRTGWAVLRDNLDEKGGGDQSFEAAAGSGVMIVADLKLCKGFFRRRCLIVAERQSGLFLDCRERRRTA